jgi:hypothetical protein
MARRARAVDEPWRYGEVRVINSVPPDRESVQDVCV